MALIRRSTKMEKQPAGLPVVLGTRILMIRKVRTHQLVTHNKEIQIVWDSANKILSVYSGGDIHIEAKEHVSLETQMFSVSAEQNISIEAKESIILNSGAVTGVIGGAQVQIQAPDVLIN